MERGTRAQAAHPVESSAWDSLHLTQARLGESAVPTAVLQGDACCDRPQLV